MPGFLASSATFSFSSSAPSLTRARHSCLLWFLAPPHFFIPLPPCLLPLSPESRLKYDYVERAAKLPGPGQYKSFDSVGTQLNSKKTTLPMYGFGTSDRDHRHKVYISQEHDKVCERAGG